MIIIIINIQKMKKIINPTLIVLINFLVFSCTSKKELNYMKNIDDLATEASIASVSASSTIQSGDQLGIIITADDMEVVAPFNLNPSPTEIITNTLPSSNIQVRGNQTQVPTYIVKTDGTIDFPILGKLDTKGKTIEEFSEVIKQKMKKYVIKPVVVSVNTLNYKVTVLGQVSRPGTYTINDGQATLLSALGLAGDLTNYALRDNVLVVRNENGQITKTRVDLTKADFINSPFYKIKQNDVIYVSGNETIAKTSRLDPNAGIYISVASIVVTILALVFKN